MSPEAHTIRNLKFLSKYSAMISREILGEKLAKLLSFALFNEKIVEKKNWVKNS